MMVLCRGLNVLSVAKQEKNLNPTRFIFINVLTVGMYVTLGVLLTFIYYGSSHYTFECEKTGTIIPETSTKFMTGVCKCEQYDWFSGDLRLLMNYTDRLHPSKLGTYYVPNAFPLCASGINGGLQICEYKDSSYICYIIRKDGKSFGAVLYDCSSYGVCVPTGEYIATFSIFGSYINSAYVIWNVTVGTLPVMCCGFNKIGSSDNLYAVVSFIGGVLAITHFFIKHLFDPIVRSKKRKWTSSAQTVPMLDVVSHH